MTADPDNSASDSIEADTASSAYPCVLPPLRTPHQRYRWIPAGSPLTVRDINDPNQYRPEIDPQIVCNADHYGKLLDDDAKHLIEGLDERQRRYLTNEYGDEPIYLVFAEAANMQGIDADANVQLPVHAHSGRTTLTIQMQRPYDKEDPEQRVAISEWNYLSGHAEAIRKKCVVQHDVGGTVRSGERVLPGDYPEYAASPPLMTVSISGPNQDPKMGFDLICSMRYRCPLVVGPFDADCPPNKRQRTDPDGDTTFGATATS